MEECRENAKKHKYLKIFYTYGRFRGNLTSLLTCARAFDNAVSLWVDMHGKWVILLMLGIILRAQIQNTTIQCK